MRIRNNYEAQLAKLRAENERLRIQEMAATMSTAGHLEETGERIAKLRAENERLRALLPDMLAACEDALSTLESEIAVDGYFGEKPDSQVVESVELLKAALAKAKGE